LEGVPSPGLVFCPPVDTNATWSRFAGEEFTLHGRFAPRRMKAGEFLGELKRRNVYKAGVAYGVFAWLLIQIATQVFPIFDIPNWAVRLVILILLIGLPVMLVFAWIFEITPEGLKRTQEVPRDDSITHRTGRK